MLNPECWKVASLVHSTYSRPEVTKMLLPSLVLPTSASVTHYAVIDINILDIRKMSAKPKTSLIEHGKFSSSRDLHCSQQELRKKQNLSGLQIDLRGQMPAKSSCLASALRDCTYPAIVCGHAARAQCRGPREGSYGNIASVHRTHGPFQMACGGLCIAAIQRRSAPSGMERGVLKRYCFEQTKSTHLANHCKKTAIVTIY